MALEDYLARRVRQAIKDVTGRRRGSGKGGMIAVDAGGQEVLDRTAVVVTPRWVEARIEVGLPAAGRQGAGRDLDVALYAGPKDPDILKDEPAYTLPGMGDLIVYSLGGPCAFCTFAWLADLLMWFLSQIAVFLMDWGIAIIVLVAIVRTLLHPLTKRSQVNMMKVGKQMQAIQPEMERLKEKYKDDQQKLNQEMMNLYREKGVNPAAMGLGCLPMFLQMPIWIALYAVLYFAVELRHTPAFWGVFQRMTGGEWLFMADLSAQDHFFMFPAPLDLGFLTLESINLLPILMMGVFFLQQKYTTAPTTAQSEQAQMQQRMMKWMIRTSMLAIRIQIKNISCSSLMSSLMSRRCSR